MYENGIDRLLNLMGIDFNAIVSNWLDETIKNINAQNPSIPESELALFRETLRQNIDIKELHNRYAAIYNRYFTQDEIAELIKFYENPLGQKALAADQQINQDIQAISVAYFESISNEVIQEMVAEES